MIRDVMGCLKKLIKNRKILVINQNEIEREVLNNP